MFFTDVLFAGAMVGPERVKPNWDKVVAVVDWQTPKDVKDLMAFLGLTNFLDDILRTTQELQCHYRTSHETSR